MARIKNAAAKKLWQDLTPYQQFDAFCIGDSYAKEPGAYAFAMRTYALLEWLKEQKGSVSVFKKAVAGSIEEDSQQAMNEAMAFMFNCWLEPNGTNSLRNLADAIDSLKKPLMPAVDRYRAWLWCAYLSPCNGTGPKRPVRLRQTFAEVRDAFDKEFKDNRVQDCQLRPMLKDLGIVTAPDKKGPKGPRIR